MNFSKITSIQSLSLLTVLPFVASAQVTLQEFLFDDADGTAFSEVLNSGDPGDWVFNAGLTEQQAVVTNGAVRFLGASTGDAGGTMNNLTTGSAVFTTGTYDFSLTVKDFDFSGEATLGWVQFLLKSAGSNMFILRVQESPDSTLRLWVRSGNGGEFFPLAGVTASTGEVITFSVQINLDDQTFTLSIDSFEDANDVASMGPMPFNAVNEAGEMTAISFASQLNTTTSAATDYLEFGEFRLTGPEYVVIQDTWAGYEIDENGWADTSGFMSWINVYHAPWIWSTALDRWLYMPEENVSDSGGWVYAGK